MRIRPALLAAALLLPSLALADEASELEDRVVQLEAQVATLRASLPAKPSYRTRPTKPVQASATQRAAAQVFHWRRPFFGAFGVPVFPATISGGGGFTGGTVASARSE